MSSGTVARAIGLCLTGTSLLFFSSAAQAAPAPEGSYQQSCRNFTASRGTLTAECKTRAGVWTSTTLDNYRGCSGDISNNNGSLTCDRADDTSGGGSGGGGGSNADRNDDDQGGSQGSSHRSRDHDDADDNDDDSNREVRTPRGSYSDTCRNVHIDGDDLVGECRTRDGEWHRTTLDDFRRCNGDISNQDGRLRCDREDGDRGDRGDRGDDDRGDRGGWKPDGSYQETCRHVRVEHGDLSARCRSRDGDWRRSELENFRECRGDIANDNGHLVCSRGRWRITLYQHARFGGRSRSYSDDQPWLGDFSDIASSAYVQGGRWQLCTKRYYRGRCVTVDANVGNFNYLGINDRVESLRRVR